MSFSFKDKLLLAKVESGYGNDPTPVEGSDAILTQNLTVKPYEGDRVERNLDQGALGLSEEINVGAFVEIEFDVEIAGSSGKVAAPAFGVLLDSCALEETITATTGPIQYDPESLETGFDSSTLYFNADGEQQIIVGCRGNMTISLERGQLPHFHFRFLGKYAKPTAVTQYNPTLTNWILPQPVNKANTGTVTLGSGSEAQIMESFNFDLGNVVVYRNLPGSEEVIITDRAPTGNIVVEAPLLATQDMYALVESHSAVVKYALVIVHGSSATNRFTFNGPTVQVSTIERQESDGITMYNLGLRFIPTSAGDDEFNMIVTGP